MLSKIKAVEADGKNQIEELHVTTTLECQRNKQEVLKKLEERHKEIQTDISERVGRVYTTINKVDGQTQENKEKIQGISQRERPVSYTHLDVYKRQVWCGVYGCQKRPQVV